MRYLFCTVLALSLCACGSSGGGGSSTPPVVVNPDPIPLAGWVGGYTGSTLQILSSSGDAAGNWVGVYYLSGSFSCTNNNASVPLITLQANGEGWIGYGLFRVDGAHSEYWRMTIDESSAGLRLDIDLYRGPSSASPETYAPHPSNASRFTADLIKVSAG